MKFLYTLGIRFYGFAILLASLFNEKAKKWRQGRKDIFKKLRDTFSNVKEPVIWLHCSSLGEFEQGRPVIEAFRQKYPGYKILLTFFSPSGYEIRKNYNGADFVFYLPLDTFSNAKRFIEITKPTLAVFVKYEFWYNYLQCLHSSNVPVYLISAMFRPDQYFFKGYASWFRKQLKEYKKIFVQDVNSKKLLKSIGIEKVVIAGDTRFDRVVAIAEQAKPDLLVKAFKGNNTLWICGSTWFPDEAIIKEAFNKITAEGNKVKLLLVPHEIGESHITEILNSFPGAIRYSLAKENEVANANVLVVDKIGLLSNLYQYGDIAYIGGGFGIGIHNTQEAAVYGMPVLFGPKYQKFNEAVELVKMRAGVSISTSAELIEHMSRLIKDKDYR
ncbi:MAG TPA: glycosyltransferase N-terminal domain-containing protein, partial [Bacteroidia bacterium]|nr:glycosyltransferase N-terminal domain-containing protein [Bacteroidia bacterium]